MERARERVTLGAALLDRERPGWRDEINLDVLNLADTGDCVLGQLFDEPVDLPVWKVLDCESREWYVEWRVREHGITRTVAEGYADETSCQANFEAGRRILGLSETQCREYGFDVCDDYWDGDATEPSYADLDLAWLEIIKTP
jgi:hypothetical protein